MKKFKILRQDVLTSNQKHIIVGMLLSNGIMNKSTNGNFRIKFKLNEGNFWIKDVLKNIISVDGYNLTTNYHQGLNEFGKTFYTASRKKVIPNNLDMLFDHKCLLIMLQSICSFKGETIRMNTFYFDMESNTRLQQYLKKIFNINSKVIEYSFKNAKQYYISINKENTIKLLGILND